MAGITEYDFSLLPEVAWINILKDMSLEDRYRLSQTCHTLRQHFHHPSVWHTVTIKFTAEDGKMPGELVRRPEEVHLTNKYQSMIEQFGEYFQDLTLVFYGIITGLTQAHRDVIAELGKKCRLKSLTLEVGIAPSTLNVNDLSMNTSDLESITLAVTNAFRMKSFYLKSWPSFEKVNILDGLMSNERLKNLETLNILYRCAAEATWTTVHAPVPSTDNIIQLVQHFRNLSSLSIRSDLLTEDVVKELTKIGKLKSLQVMVVYSSRTRRGLQEISSQVWSRLVDSCPELSVHLNFVNQLPYMERAGYMKPEIPLTAVSFMKYANCTPTDIGLIAEKYSEKLVKFVNFSDSGEFDDQLVTLASRCNGLTHFTSCGPVMDHTVLQLAQMKGENWKYFQVKKDKVTFPTQGEQFDEDTVIAKTSSGQVVMTNMERLMANREEDREQQYSEFVENVSHVLNRKWEPLPSNFMEEDLKHLQSMNKHEFLTG